MANISDASGEILVEKVGQDFLDFLEVAQKDGYYLLAEDLSGLEPDADGDISFDFYAGGRWSYETNLRGYLEGEWMNGGVEQEAYEKLMKAIKDKDGLISIQYQDSDVGMDWMGSGVFEVVLHEGEVLCNHSFEEESITLERFAEVNGDSEEWALEYIYGDEAAEAYDEYSEDCKERGVEPVEPQNWLDDIYEEV